VLTVAKSAEQQVKRIYKDHGQLSQGVEQTVPSIIIVLCNVGVQCTSISETGKTHLERCATQLKTYLVALALQG